MIESIITDYLGHNRRLVIPGLGAFLKKEDGQTVFVPFLNKDDGVLSGLVRQAYGTSPAETEGVIDRYVEAVREGIESHGIYRIIPLGSLKKDTNGIVYLDTADRTAPPSASAAPAPKATSVPQPEAVEEPFIRPESFKEPEPASAIFATETTSVRATHSAAEPAPAKTVADTVDSPRTINDLIREKQESTEAAPQTVHSRMAEERKPEAPKQPVTSPRSPAAATPYPAPRQPAQAPQRKAPPTAAQREKRGDVILILAVVVAVLAIAAMIYAYAVVDLPLFNLQ